MVGIYPWGGNKLGNKKSVNEISNFGLRWRSFSELSRNASFFIPGGHAKQ